MIRVLVAFFSVACAWGAEADQLQWFREAKFGMFIHWGPYSALAGEWGGKRVPVGSNAEWIMQLLKIPVAEYRELARGFNPVTFDAHRWARLARDAGMKSYGQDIRRTGRLATAYDVDSPCARTSGRDFWRT